MAVATLPFAVAASDRSADAVLVQALRAALRGRDADDLDTVARLAHWPVDALRVATARAERSLADEPSALVARAHRLLDGALHHHSDIEDMEP